MLETLTGRLKWERRGDGIRVVIPARLSWGVIRRLLGDLGGYVLGFLSIFVIAGFVAYFRGLSFRSYLVSEGAHSLYFVSLGCCTGLILAKIVPRLFGETFVLLSPIQIAVEWNARIWRSKEVFPTAVLHSFRFVERSSEIPVQNKIGQNEIHLGQTPWTRSFAEGVTREEAEALNAKMMEFYNSSSCQPTEFKAVMSG